jgi:hypothetical protein
LLSPSRCTTPPPWLSEAPRRRRCSSNSRLPCVPQRAPPPSQRRAPPRAHARSSRQSLEWPHHLAVRPQAARARSHATMGRLGPSRGHREVRLVMEMLHRHFPPPPASRPRPETAKP